MIRMLIVVLALLVAFPAFSQDSSGKDFQRTGTVDAIYATEGRIVIGDIPYPFSPNVIVHSTNSYRLPFSRVRTGVKVGFKMSSAGEITELWLLPKNYSDRR